MGDGNDESGILATACAYWSTIPEGLKLSPPKIWHTRTSEYVKRPYEYKMEKQYDSCEIDGYSSLLSDENKMFVPNNSAQDHKVIQNPIMDHWNDSVGANSRKALVKKMLAKAVIGEDIKDMELIKTMFDYAHIMEYIKGNGGVMRRIHDNTTAMEYYYSCLKDMAAKTAATGRVMMNPSYSLSSIGPSVPMNTNYYYLKLDSGASMHVVGDYKMLKECKYFHDASYTVILPDNSQLNIVGVGTIKTGHFSIPDVYLVSGLQTSLISVSQLDKRHGLCCAFFHNKCEVMNADGEIVGGAILEENGMYVLRFLKVLV